MSAHCSSNHLSCVRTDEMIAWRATTELPIATLDESLSEKISAVSREASLIDWWHSKSYSSDQGGNMSESSMVRQARGTDPPLSDSGFPSNQAPNRYRV